MEEFVGSGVYPSREVHTSVEEVGEPVLRDLKATVGDSPSDRRDISVVESFTRSSSVHRFRRSSLKEG
jgi:hypothetical protein